MYTAQLTIDRIQALIKLKGITQKKLLSDCGISENTLKSMTDNRGISSFYLAKIADQLNCSVDYLLGRTNAPTETLPNNGIVQNNVNSPIQVQENNITNFHHEQSQKFDDKSDLNNAIEKEFSSIISILTPAEKMELMMSIYQFADNHAKK